MTVGVYIAGFYGHSLLGNPVTTKQHYRLYMISKVPQLRILDFRKVKMQVSPSPGTSLSGCQRMGEILMQPLFSLAIQERKEAKSLFKGKKGAALATSIGKRSKTFVPGAELDKPTINKHDKEREEAIKVCRPVQSMCPIGPRLPPLMLASFFTWQGLCLHLCSFFTTDFCNLFVMII